MSNETEKQTIRTAIAALEAQRTLLGDAVVEVSIDALQTKLSSLAGPSEPDQQLKLVTIVFLDMVGSTTLSQCLEPEEIHAFMERALLRFSGTVEAHNGRVLRLAGDSLMAAFGVERVNEDDAERAVHCGLALREEGHELSAEVHREHGYEDFNVRVGIHTGVVLVGGVVDAGIHGLAVNIAARLEQTAPAGGVLISHSTYSHLGDRFDVSAPERIEVKGVKDPVVCHLVHRATQNRSQIALRGWASTATRMIGRAAELEQIKSSFYRFCEERKSTKLIVSAETGLGKSRLLYEFHDQAKTHSDKITAFWGRATPDVLRQPYGLLRRILVAPLQIADSDSMSEAMRKCEREIFRLFESDQSFDRATVQTHSHVLGYLIGLDFGTSNQINRIRDVKHIRDRGFYVAAQILWRAANKMPFVLLLDDLQWADDESLDFLGYLAASSHDMPMMLLAVARPAIFERRPDLRGVFDQEIDLRPLDQTATNELASELLKKLPDIPQALSSLIAGRAEGNPYFMEELVRMLLDEGAIEDSDGGWRLRKGKLFATNVPQTLTGVLQSRLDRLKPGEKLALQQASVIGAVFWDHALAAIDAHGIAALPALSKRNLVISREWSSMDAAREYAFSHLILHDVAYNSLLRRVRRAYHGKVAEWLVATTGSRSSDLLEETAMHFEQAGDSLRACEYFTRAADYSRSRFAHTATLNNVERALRLVGEKEDRDNWLRRWHLIQIRERTVELAGRRVEQLADLNALQQIADALDDDSRRSEVACRLSDLHLRDSNFQAMERASKLAVALAEGAGDHELRLRGLRSVATAACMLGNTKVAAELALGALTSARSLGFRHLEPLLLRTQMFIMDVEGDLTGALKLSKERLAIECEIGDPRGVADATVNLGVSWLNFGELEQSKCYLELGLRQMREIGNRVGEPYPLVGLSTLALWMGDDALAAANAKLALDIATAVKDPNIEREALLALAGAELSLGRHQEAGSAYEQALSLAHSLDAAACFVPTAGLARVALSQGDAEGALRAVQTVLSHLSNDGSLAGGVSQGQHVIRLNCFKALQRAGDSRANEAISNAHNHLMRVADRITDASLRESYLTNIPEHREIVSEWSMYMNRQ